ncbi:MAG: squalene/phytoene synthase family protein, partial [Blastocatellia bacterium]|nr:squalene/phytoene synthase family protein [Blastocatellia bacterium]
EQELFNSVYNSNFVNLMKFQAERAHSFFHRAQELLSPLDRSGMFAAEIMGRIYSKILQKIETANFDVFNNSFKLSKFEKASAVIIS